MLTPDIRGARLLAAAADGDAALYYLWLCAGEDAAPCPLSGQRLSHARALLEQLGLLPREERPLERETRPVYSEQAVTKSLADREFQMLVGETQRQLGRVLSTEEIKCLLSIYDYLRLPGEVVSLLISYCIRRAQSRGGRLPNMRTIEKEAYFWADQGIDTVPAAVAHVQKKLLEQQRTVSMARVLQITDRRLTPAEEKYVRQWLDWGFPEKTVQMAYERTCLNTGGLKWPYLNAILKSWQEKGLHTPEEVSAGDGAAPAAGSKKKPAVSEMEREAIKKLMGSGEG